MKKDIPQLPVAFVAVLLLLAVGVGWILKGMVISQKDIPTQSISSLNEAADNYSMYESTFKRDGQVFRGAPISKDLTGDGQPELIFTTVGEGCASCHAKNIYIFQDKKELLKLELSDPIFYPLPGRGFLVVEPVEGRDSCCPTSFQNAVYLWDGETFKVR